jgi:hypothetical protein
MNSFGRTKMPARRASVSFMAIMVAPVSTTPFTRRELKLNSAT